MSALPLAPTRELLLHPDPAKVSAWCRAHATPGAILVAPSAAARRLALQEVVAHRTVSLGLTVCSPRRLLSVLESRAGIPAPAQLSAALEDLLVTEAARAARVPLFDDPAESPPAGAVHAVATLIRTLRLNRVTPDAFEQAGGSERAGAAYRRFESRRIALGFHDETDRIDALLAAGVPALPLVLEDPSVPHLAAWVLLRAALAASTSCHVGLSALDQIAGAPAWVAELEATLGFTVTRTQPPAPTGAKANKPTTRAIGGVGIQDEVELAAREMLALLRSDASLRPSELLAVAPNREYLALLGDACTRLGIPVASPRHVAVADVPLVRALLDAFELLADPDQDTTERGLALLATPYVGLSLDRHDRLSRTLLVRGLGAIRTWRRFADSSRSRKFMALATDVARLADRLAGARAPKELTATLATLGLDFGFVSSGRRFNLSARRDDALRVDEAGFESLVETAEELNEALRIIGIARISARDWLVELTRLLAASTVKVDAKARDGVHLTIAGAGLPSAAHVFAVGWREGLFPRRTREEPFFPERVKKALNEAGAMIPLAADRTAREQERRERIRLAARETLTISWPSTTEEGDQLLPSFYLDDLGVTDRAVRSVGDTTWPLGLAASRGERLARATYVARHRSAQSAGTELDAVRDALSSLSVTERRAYDGLLHAGRVIQLPPDVLAECTPLAGSMSASQSHLLAHCLYQHFGKRRLELGALGAPQVDPLALGSIAHNVLADVGRLGFRPEALDDVFERWWTDTVSAELRDDPQVRFDREILHTNLTDLVAHEHAHFSASESRPAYFELAFGTNDDGRDPASLATGLDVSLPSGTPLASSTLRGSIDRVDVVERGGKRFGVAIDYKSGRGKYNFEEMEELADFQLPIYCEVLPLFGIEPVGAVYLGISSGERYGVVRSDFAEVFRPAGAKGMKVLDLAVFQEYMTGRQIALRHEIARLAKGELVTRPRNDDCGWCDLRPVCRIGTFGVGGRPEDD
jgi:hypothetical protein